MRWKWRTEGTWDDLEQLPQPLALLLGSSHALATVRDVVVYLLILGFAIACLVVGANIAHYIGVVLIAGCLFVGLKFVRKHVT